MKTKITIFGIALLFAMQTTHAQEALRLQMGPSYVENFLLDNIRKLTFSSGNINVSTADGKTTAFPLGEIIKMSFGAKLITDIAHPSAGDLDVLAFVTPAGEIVVESSVVIRSLALVGIDGRIIFMENYNLANAVQTARIMQPQLTGMYLLRVETSQGIVVKKLINSKNHF